MSTIVIPCPQCGYQLRLPDRGFVGRKGRCPECQLKFILEESLIIDEAEAQRVTEERRRAAQAEAARVEQERLAAEQRLAEEQSRRAEEIRLADERQRAKEEEAAAARAAEERQAAEKRREDERRRQAEEERLAAERLAEEERQQARRRDALAGDTVQRDPALAETHLNPLLDAEDEYAVEHAPAGDTQSEPPDIETVEYDEKSAAALADVIGADDAEVPKQLGRYRIVELIGEGSMGAVYLAHDTELDRQVALKIPRFSEPEQSDERERFYREARAAATLRHPSICQVFDIGEAEGLHFIAMQYIKGHPLSSFIGQKKPQPVRKVAGTLRKLAKALQVAHEKGLVHRDLKPDNIMIDGRGEPIIMDFGLVRMMDDDNQLTASGAIIGSPAYMSPEQVEGQPDDVGPASDIFSLGIIAYELLTQRRPFRGKLSDIFDQILRSDPVPPSKLRPEVDPVFESICLTMLAKRVSDRYASMSHLSEALGSYLADSPSSPSIRIDPVKSSQTPAPSSAVLKSAALGPDELAARWVLDIGGALKISTADAPAVAVSDLNSLPTSPFHVVDVSLLKNAVVDDAGLKHLQSLNHLAVLRLSETGITDAGLTCLSGLTSLPVLDLSYTKVTDAGLKHLRGMKGLKQLDLANTKVTDAGLSHVKRLSGLQFLGLYATTVTDSGLKTLAALKNLQFLGLYGTKVTDSGVARLKKALRGCTISR